MPEPDEQRERGSRRAEGQRRFDAVAGHLLGLPGVSAAPMFGSTGLRYGDRFFAFVGRDGRLVVKLPADQAAHLVATHAGTPVRAGRHATREWLSVPWPDERGAERWGALVDDAYRNAADRQQSGGTARD